MTIQQSIEKAIEGGWQDLHSLKHWNGNWAYCYTKLKCMILDEESGEEVESFVTKSFHTGDIFLDPKFWQALGKTMGWEKGVTYRQSVPARKGPKGTSYPAVIRMQRSAPRPNEWKKKWHGLINALAEDRSIEDYLATL